MFQRRESSTWLKCLTDLSSLRPGEAERSGMVEEKELGLIGLTVNCAPPLSFLERFSIVRGNHRIYPTFEICTVNSKAVTALGPKCLKIQCERAGDVTPRARACDMETVLSRSCVSLTSTR